MGRVLITDVDSDYTKMMSRYVATMGLEAHRASTLSTGRKLALEASW